MKSLSKRVREVSALELCKAGMALHLRLKHQMEVSVDESYMEVVSKNLQCPSCGGWLNLYMRWLREPE